MINRDWLTENSKLKRSIRKNMKLLMICGTWIHEWDKAVIDYIRSCDIFPNTSMIVEATGLPEKRVNHTLRMLRSQEGMCVGRWGLFEDENSTKTRKDILIHCLMDKDHMDIAAFLEANRYYDANGDIHYRFTEEEVIHSFYQYYYN